jgi:hypothetical protein
MYTTTRNMAGGTLTKCKDCGYAISMNKICEKPIQSATDMLKHMAAHKASRALAPVAPVIRAEPEAVPLLELARALGVPTPVHRFDSPTTRPSPLPRSTDSTGYSLDQIRLSEALLTM